MESRNSNAPSVTAKTGLVHMSSRLGMQGSGKPRATLLLAGLDMGIVCYLRGVFVSHSSPCYGSCQGNQILSPAFSCFSRTLLKSTSACMFRLYLHMTSIPPKREVMFVLPFWGAEILKTVSLLFENNFEVSMTVSSQQKHGLKLEYLKLILKSRNYWEYINCFWSVQ